MCTNVVQLVRKKLVIAKLFGTVFLLAFLLGL